MGGSRLHDIPWYKALAWVAILSVVAVACLTYNVVTGRAMREQD